MNTYTVTEAAAKLNLSAKTLRRWEETGRFTSGRTLGGQRRYSTEDIQILDAINSSLITTQSDLLTREQAAHLAGVSEATITRWENEGQLHSFITSSNTYYIKSHLLEVLSKSSRPTNTPQTPSSRMDQLEAKAPTPTERTEIEPHPPTPHLTTLNLPTQSVDQTLPNLLTTRTQDALLRHDLKLTILNVLITTTLIAGYHLITQNLNTPPQPISKNTGSVQGASTTNDPKIETLKNLIDQTGNFTTSGSVRVGGQFITPRFTLSPTTRPTKPVAGTIYFDASTQALEFYDGTKWEVLTPQQTQPLTTPSPTPSNSPSTSTTLTPVSQTLR